MLKHMALLFLVSSCAFFRGQPSLIKMDKEKLLASVKLTGEGRGRLTLGQTQYVFGVDSILNENHDWILAVQIPLHGEEVMILPDLRQKEIAEEEMESFEERIEKEFNKLKLNKIITSQRFIEEMRSLVRFVLAPQWGGKRDCVARQEDMSCTLDGQKFLVNATDKEFIIEKSVEKEITLQVVAKNLSKSFFGQTDILLHTERSEKMKEKPSSFSMEFFW